MDQRTRERLPVPPALTARAGAERITAAGRLHAARAAVPGETFTARGQALRQAVMKTETTGRIWAADPGTGKRRDLSFEEHRGFWCWAMIKVLRMTGIRIEELTELSSRRARGRDACGSGRPRSRFAAARSCPAAPQLLAPGSRARSARACRVQRACRAVRAGGPAPSPTGIPGGQIKSAGAIGAERTCHGNHVIRPVVPGQSGAEEDAPQVNVVGNVAAGQLLQWLPEVGPGFRRPYPRGIKISDRQMRELERTHPAGHDWHGEWNYNISPARE
jgi:hypothetical protein